MSDKRVVALSGSIQEAGGSIIRFPLISVQGVPLMNHIADNWDSISAFEPHPSDLLIATYPKAGTASQTTLKSGQDAGLNRALKCLK